MITLYDDATNEPIGQVSDEQFNFLAEQLEEESLEDRNYAITPMLLSLFEDLKADPALLRMLSVALGNRDVMEVSWEAE